MGQSSEALLSYGIIIPVSKAVALLSALRKIPPPPGKSNSRGTNKIDNVKGWGYEYTDELAERIGNQFVAAGFDWQEFELETLGSGSESGWQGVAVFFNGFYDEELGNESRGFGVDYWGRDFATCTRRIVHKPWEDEELMESAKKAFKQLAELPLFKEVGFEIDADWLQSVSVS